MSGRISSCCRVDHCCSVFSHVHLLYDNDYIYINIISIYIIGAANYINIIYNIIFIIFTNEQTNI